MLAGSPNFSLQEVLEASAPMPKARLNTEPFVSNIARALATMEAVRATLGHVPLKMTSLARTTEDNREAGGSDASHHLVGNAVDFVPLGGLTASEAFDILRQPGTLRALKLDELVGYDTHVHVSVDLRQRGKVIDKRTAATTAPRAQADATTVAQSPTPAPGGCATVIAGIVGLGIVPLALLASTL